MSASSPEKGKAKIPASLASDRYYDWYMRNLVDKKRAPLGDVAWPSSTYHKILTGECICLYPGKDGERLCGKILTERGNLVKHYKVAHLDVHDPPIVPPVSDPKTNKPSADASHVYYKKLHTSHKAARQSGATYETLDDDSDMEEAQAGPSQRSAAIPEGKMIIDKMNMPYKADKKSGGDKEINKTALVAVGKAFDWNMPCGNAACARGKHCLADSSCSFWNNFKH